jgi:hypothetical protein
MGWAVQGLNPGRGKILNSSQNIRPDLESTQSPLQLVSEVISPRWGQEDWLQHDVDQSMCLSLRL